MSALRAFVQRLQAWYLATRAGRAWKRYGDARGSVLAAGVGYFAFFSVFPAVALAATVFGFVLRGRPDLLDRITASLKETLPGFVRDAGNPQGIITIAAPASGALTVTAIIALVGLVLAGLGWLGAARDGIRAVFGVSGGGGNLFTNKLRDLAVLAILGVGIAVSAVLTSVIGGAAGWLAALVGLGGQAWLLTGAGLVVSVVIDAGLMMALLRLVPGVSLPWSGLLQGALVGGVGFTVLKYFGAALIARTMSNPLFASFAIVVGLLVWLNLIARLMLLSAAWAAGDLRASGDRLVRPDEPVLAGGGTSAELATAELATAGSAGDHADSVGRPRPRDPALPSFGARSGDRTTLAAGAVLGAGAAMALGLLGRGLRALRRED